MSPEVALANAWVAYVLTGMFIALIGLVMSRESPDVRDLPPAFLVWAVLTMMVLWPLVLLEWDNDNGPWRG